MGWDFPGGTNKDEQGRQWSAVRKSNTRGLCPFWLWRKYGKVYIFPDRPGSKQMCRGRENSGLGLGGLAVSVSSFWGGHLTVLHVQESLHCAFKVGELPW